MVAALTAFAATASLTASLAASLTASSTVAAQGDGPSDPLSATDDGATTIMVNPLTVVSPFVPSDPTSQFGRELHRIDIGVVAVGRQGLSGSTAGVIPLPSDRGSPAAGLPAVSDVLFAERTLVASGARIVVVDARRLRLLRIDETGRTREVSSIGIEGSGSFGAVASFDGDTVAVQHLIDGTLSGADSMTTVVDVFDVSDDRLTPAVALRTDIGRPHLAVGAGGESIAISGVRDRADNGEIQFFVRRDANWGFGQRFDAIGGGPIATSGESFYVQRNGFFTRAAGPWTELAPDDEGSLRILRELPVQASSLTVDGDLLAFGLAAHDRVLTFASIVDPVDPSASRVVHAQILGPSPLLGADGEPLREVPSGFGAAVLFAGGRLIVSSPGVIVAGLGNEGSIVAYTTALGPRGCTVVGTDGDDVLQGTVGDDVICGLAGNDTIDANKGRDRLYGGPGDDDLRGAGDDDLVVGGTGADRLDGGQGADTLAGGDGNDVLFGGADDDAFDGGLGQDGCFGGGGLDTFVDC